MYFTERYGFWALSRWEDVSAAHKDVSAFSSSYGTDLHFLSDPERIPYKMILYMDPPEHDRLRALVSRVFTPRAIGQLEPMVRQVITGFADEIGGADTFDLVQQWSGPFPGGDHLRMLGIPAGDRQQIRHWLDIILHRERGQHPSVPGVRGRSGGVGHVLLEPGPGAPAHPTDDMITRLIEAEVDRGDGVTTRLDDEEIAGFLSLLAGAGRRDGDQAGGQRRRALPPQPRPVAPGAR